MCFISYVFPPLPAGGSIRSKNFSKYLTHYGWTAHILTVKNQSSYSEDQIREINGIPPEVTIHRAFSLDPFASKRGAFSQSKQSIIAKLIRWLAAFFLVPDRQILWLPFAVAKGFFMMKQYRCDIIFSTFGPASNHLAGLILKKLFKKPWVADFRDVWTTNQNMFFPTPLHRKFQQYLERKIVQSADLITSVGEHINQDLRLWAANQDKFKTITNGFDPELIEEALGKTASKNTKPPFTIAYMGAFYGGRYPDTFFQSVSELIEEKKIDAAHTRIRFVSNLTALPHRWIHPLSPITELRPLCSQREALRQISDASALLVMVEEEMKEKIVNAKIFDYMALQKPILAVIPKDGVCADYLRPLSFAHLVSPSSIADLKKVILQLYEDWKKNKTSANPHTDYIDQFNALTLAGQLANQFKSLSKGQHA